MPANVSNGAVIYLLLSQLAYGMALALVTTENKF